MVRVLTVGTSPHGMGSGRLEGREHPPAAGGTPNPCVPLLMPDEPLLLNLNSFTSVRG